MQLKAVIATLLTLPATQAAEAQLAGPSLGFGHKVALNISGFWADINTVARAGNSGGRVGTSLDFEQDLGLDDSDLRFIGSLNYQFARRHGIELSYLRLKRSNERTLDAQIEFRDQTFGPQRTLQSEFQSEIWRLSYSYAFVDNPRHRATAQAGMHYLRLAANLNGVEAANSAEASANAPLPVIGATYAYRFSPRWMLELRGQIFRLQVGDIDGSIDNFSAVVGVAPLQSVSLFAGYNYYRLDVGLSKPHWDGNTKVALKGPWVGFVVGFGGES